MAPARSGGVDPTFLESHWLQHKEVLHRLYIVENKTLNQVKQSMENAYSFPELRPYDYEVALRELLKLRKNLRKTDWYAIGAHISDRKIQGKESEVSWNNLTLSGRKVRKEVLRNRKLSHVCPRMTKVPELPTGLTIRTPPGSPPPETAVVAPSATYPSDSGSMDLASLGAGEFMTHASIRPWDLQIALRHPSQDNYSGARALREHLPFNRFMFLLQDLGK
ncbi:hypothetical protein Daus18300_000376 [Diaporthe australafricana]|uniref:Clr5 domain-containing protein n=1 Tax=Diaporthe australafricana TaxID=127596 RepID=A0ABR3Y666_9PEZI